MDNVVVVLVGERPISWNKFYSGMHWAKRKELADRMHMLMRAALSYPDEITDRFEEKVYITVRAYMKSPMMDADNICAKMYIDGLKEAVIYDDDWRYVKSVTTETNHDKECPRVEIHVSESPGVTGACAVYSVDVR